MSKIDAGTYLARAGEYDIGQASTGTKQIMIRMELVDEHDRPTGDTVFWYGFLSDRAVPYTMTALRRMGWTGDDICNMADEGLGSVTVPVEVSYETYGGKERMKVSLAAPGGVAMKGALDDSGKRALSARLRGAAIASRAGAAPAAAPAPAPRAAGGARPRF